MLHELKHLLLVVEHGTYREAAKHAHLSQPALTASIQRLERTAGARLLERDRRGARLSAEGRAFLPHARAALASFDAGVRVAREVAGVEHGEVRIGAGGTACTYLLPPMLAAYRKRYPRVRIVMTEMTPDEAEQALAARDIDLALVTLTRGELWLHDELVLVSPPGADASALPFVTFRAGATSRALLEQHFPKAEIAMELGSVTAVTANVRAGVGVALISRHAVDADLRAGRLTLVQDRRTPISRAIRLVHRGVDTLSPAAAAFRELLRSKRTRKR